MIFKIFPIFFQFEIEFEANLISPSMPSAKKGKFEGKDESLGKTGSYWLSYDCIKNLCKIAIYKMRVGLGLREFIQSNPISNFIFGLFPIANPISNLIFEIFPIANPISN